MKIVSWNVNGLRAVLKNSGKSLKDFLDGLEADIICLQETKAASRCQTRGLLGYDNSASTSTRQSLHVSSSLQRISWRALAVLLMDIRRTSPSVESRVATQVHCMYILDAPLSAVGYHCS